MKEKLKKFWEWLKDFLSFSIDLILIVAALFLIPFGLNYLLETYPNIKALFGESGIGEILTYLSTTFLAFLALYQNNRFRKLNRKHEQEQKTKDAEVQKLLADKDAEMQEKMAAQNKEAQDRMAELTSRANELAYKNQIINVETQRISNLQKAFSNFDYACHHWDDFNNCGSLQNRSRIQLLEQNIYRVYDSLLALGREIVNDCSTPPNNVYSDAESYKEAIEKSSLFLMNNATINDDLKEKLRKSHEAYRSSATIYLENVFKNYYELLYGDLTVEQIKDRYSKKS